MSAKKTSLGKRRSFIKAAGALTAATSLGFPFISRAEDKPIRIGVPTILSGRVAQLGISSRNAIQMEIDKFNAAGGLGGRKIEIITRDSKGKPDEAANNTRQLINGEGCEIIIDAEASSGAFAVQEVIRELKVLCIHTNSETSSLSADPKIRVPTAFRVARQGIHDAIVSAAYAGNVAKAKGLKTWMSCSPDYAYGRDNTSLFLEYLKRFHPEAELVGETWPKLFQADYTENITKILQVKPQALYSALWAGDLVSFIDQSSIYNLFAETTLFAINMADYTTMTAVPRRHPFVLALSQNLPRERGKRRVGRVLQDKVRRLPDQLVVGKLACHQFPDDGNEKDQFDGLYQAGRCDSRHEGQIAVRRGRHRDDARGRPNHDRLRAGLGHDGAQGSVCAERDAWGLEDDPRIRGGVEKENGLRVKPGPM